MRRCLSRSAIQCFGQAQRAPSRRTVDRASPSPFSSVELAELVFDGAAGLALRIIWGHPGSQRASGFQLRECAQVAADCATGAEAGFGYSRYYGPVEPRSRQRGNWLPQVCTKGTATPIEANGLICLRNEPDRFPQHREPSDLTMASRCLLSWDDGWLHRNHQVRVHLPKAKPALYGRTKHQLRPLAMGLGLRTLNNLALGLV